MDAKISLEENKVSKILSDKVFIYRSSQRFEWMLQSFNRDTLHLGC